MNQFYKVVFLFMLLSFAKDTIAQVSINKDLGIQSSELIRAYRMVDVDLAQLNTKIENADAMRSRENKLNISLPMPDGNEMAFILEEASLMEAELAARFPEIKNFRGYCPDRPEVLIRLNMGPKGLYYHISDPLKGEIALTPHQNGSKIDHKLYSTTEQYDNWSCSFDDQIDQIEDRQDTRSYSMTNNCFTNGTLLRTFRVAITTTGEFYALNGGTLPLALNALTNRLASVAVAYERDLAITFVIIGANTTIMYTNAATDPFTAPTNTNTSIGQAETTIEANIPDGDYDIGHGYHEFTCGGGCGWAGLAGLAVICKSGSKARAWTYLPNDIPGNNTVWMHEIGHQFGCRHTIYGCGTSGCQRYEPGQGHTIMSTSAGCMPADDYTNRVDYFNAGSLDQIIGFVTSGLQDNGSCVKVVGSGGTCATSAATANTAIPVVNADPSSIITNIPTGTPFMLTGSATDGNGDALTYSWEQYDTDNSNSDVPDNTGGSTTAPIFRVFSPTTSTTRYFPQMSSILSGSTTGTGEVLPTVGRSMHMRLIVRDNNPAGGAVACDEVVLTVDGSSGPFLITSQNSATTWTAGNTETVTWSVNNTDGAPINATNVEILFSEDGGSNFPYTLLATTTNDGMADITVPSVNTSTGRIMIRPLGGNYIFFDINNADITISTSCMATGGEISPVTDVTEAEGSANLNLTQTNSLGSMVSTFSGTVNASDASSNLAFGDGPLPLSCAGSNSNVYEASTFYVDAAGSYTFTRSAVFGQVTTLYTGSFNPANVCSNWIASSATRPSGSGSVSLGSSVTASLVAGQEYTIVHNIFSNNSSYYGAYTVTPTGGGNVYDGPIAPAGYLYTYIIVDAAGNIVEFDPNTDLSDNSAGMYTIYGLNYDGSSLASYVGNSYSAFLNDIISGTICANVSSNSRLVTIIGGCSSASPIPSAVGLYTSTQSFTESGMKYYCDGSGNMLLGIDETSNIADNAISLNISSTTATYLAMGTGFITADPGAGILPSTWDASGTIGADATVRYFMPSNALTLVNDAIPGVSDDLSTLSQFSFYKVTNGTKPAHSAIADLAASDVQIITNGTPSTSAWAEGTYGGKTYAEFMVSSFSGGGGGGGADGEALLPVELISFSGSNKGKINTLTWSTASEINNDYFSLERSADGQHFSSIGQVKGIGNSSKITTYTFDDKGPILGDNYYRLKQVDFDGKSTYSNVIRLTSKDRGIFQIFPNPTDKELFVRFNAAHLETGEVVILDMRGKIISRENISIVPDNNLIEINTDRLNAGSYILKLTTSNDTFVSKFIINK